MTDQPGAAPRLNEFGQPIGEPVPDWTPPPRPARQIMGGAYCRLEPLSVDGHAGALWDAYAGAADRQDWTYLAYGPFDSLDMFSLWCGEAAASADPLFFAIRGADGIAAGVASYLRVSPEAGSIEVGHIHLSRTLQRRPAATEAMYLMMRHAFALGYRRYEWKCDALNWRSRRAAERFGFSFEGTFRQALVYKGRNRDTAWYSVIDREWPRVRAAFETWLAADNFAADGTQRRRLSELMARGAER